MESICMTMLNSSINCMGGDDDDDDDEEEEEMMM